MPFGFSSSEEAFRKEIRNFLQTDVKTGLESAGGREEFPHDVWRQIGGLGLLGIGLPEAFGGRAGGSVLRGIVAEEMGKIDFPLAFALIGAYGTALAILYGGSEKQRSRYIPELVQGKIIGSVGMTEPDCGSDLSGIHTHARRDGDFYCINGEKSYVSWGMVAAVHWLFCKIDNDTDSQPLTTFLLPLEAPGVSRSESPQMGLNSTRHCAVFFDDVRISAEDRLGDAGGAFQLASQVFPHTRMILALAALGAAQASLQDAIAFAEKRKAFGKTLGKFQGVAFKIAEHSAILDAVRWQCFRTLWMMGQGKRCVKEIAMCKYLSSDVALRIIHDSMLLHGHRGYSTRLPLEGRYRDMVGLEIAEATPQILKLTIAEEIFGKAMRPFL